MTSQHEVDFARMSDKELVESLEERAEYWEYSSPKEMYAIALLREAAHRLKRDEELP